MNSPKNLIITILVLIVIVPSLISLSTGKIVSEQSQVISVQQSEEPTSEVRIIENPNNTQFVYGQPNANLTWKLDQTVNATVWYEIVDLGSSRLGLNGNSSTEPKHKQWINLLSLQLEWEILSIRDTVASRLNITMYLIVHIDGRDVTMTDSALVEIIPDTFAPKIEVIDAPREAIAGNVTTFTLNVSDHNIPFLSEILINNEPVAKNGSGTVPMEDFSLNFQEIEFSVIFEEVGEFNLTVFVEDTYENRGTITITGTTISGNTANAADETDDSGEISSLQENTNQSTTPSTQSPQLPIQLWSVLLSFGFIAVTIQLKRNQEL